MTPYREVVIKAGEEDFNDDIDPESELGKKLVFRDGLRPLIYLAPLEADIVEFFKTPEAVNEVLHRVMRETQATERGPTK
jgi:hypothetical protein